MKRLFIAIPIQEKTRSEIVSGIFRNPAVQKMPVRWTAVQNLHLTLQFLGDVEEKRIPELRKILERTDTISKTEKLQFASVGAFPNLSSPRILWLGIQKNDALLKLQQQITRDLTDSGFEVDTKKYRPHLTLGRVRENAAPGPEAAAFLEELRSGVSISDSPLDRVTLFESRLRPGGPIYTVLCEKLLFS